VIKKNVIFFNEIFKKQKHDRRVGLGLQKQIIDKKG
jgi:hypothetical protein